MAVRKMLSALFVISCLSIAVPAFAAHPLATDDAGTTGMMKFQLETSTEIGWDKESGNGSVTKSNSQTLNAALTAGLLDSVDLVVCAPYTFQQIKTDGILVRDNSGFGDVTLAVKWRFLELGPVSMAVKPAVTLPSGNRNRDLGVGRPAYSGTLITTVEFKPVAIHANAGYSNQLYLDRDKDGSRQDLWSFSLAGAVEVMKGLQLVAAVGMATNPDKANSTMPAFITGGTIYSVNDHLDLDLGLKGGLNAPEVDLALLAGITIKFP